MQWCSSRVSTVWAWLHTPVVADTADNADNGSVIADVSRHRHQGLLQRFTDENNKAQKYLLHAIEGLVQKYPSVLGKVG